MAEHRRQLLELSRQIAAHPARQGGVVRLVESDSQVRILRGVQAYVAEHGELPSVRELAARVGLSPSTVSYHVSRLRAAGEDVGTRGRPSTRCPHCGR